MFVMPKENQYGPYFEYNMSKAMASDLLTNRIGEDKKMRPHDYLVKVVNSEFGVMGTCIKVNVD